MHALEEEDAIAHSPLDAALVSLTPIYLIEDVSDESRAGSAQLAQLRSRDAQE